MQLYCESLSGYKRLATREVMVGDLALGNFNPIRVQTMTTTDTMDTDGTVQQAIRCIRAGAELVRITAPSKNEAENLLRIKNALRALGYQTPLVADIHFTPNAAEIAARIVEKVRINPGNYLDRKKFEHIEYTDGTYQNEIERIRDRFRPLLKICKEYGTALRIGTNHGSLSDRIMSRYGDTPTGMVESAMEFLRIAEDEGFYSIVLSMKSSNPKVMVQAYRLLISKMGEEGMHYPLHLGVTEAGDGEDGRIKSAVGIGTLLEDGIGDTIRVSLTEEPEQEIPVCRNLVGRYELRERLPTPVHPVGEIPYDPFTFNRRPTRETGLIGGKQVPVVISDFSHLKSFGESVLPAAGFSRKSDAGPWTPGDASPDYIYSGDFMPSFSGDEKIRIICNSGTWMELTVRKNIFPLFRPADYLQTVLKSDEINFIRTDLCSPELMEAIRMDPTAVLVLESTDPNAMASIRVQFMKLMSQGVLTPVIIRVLANQQDEDQTLIQFAVESGALLLDGMGDGILLSDDPVNPILDPASANRLAFGILQATRNRISKTDYISCPSCGRTQFELMETTSRIRSVTSHLKGVKIAIMGCIVNGPGEMADADFGYVGSGLGKITLYRGKDVVKRGLNPEVAVDELIRLIRENGMWSDPAPSGPGSAS